MPRRKKDYEDEEERGLAEGSRHTIWAVIFIALAIFFAIAAFGTAGLIGNSVFSGLSYLFGKGYYLIPAILLLVGLSFFKALRPKVMKMNLIGGVIFLIAGLGLVEMIFGNGSGGLVGRGIAGGSQMLVGKASGIILGALLLISFVVIFNTTITLENLGNIFRRKEGNDLDEDDEYYDEDLGDEEYEDEPEEEYEEDEELEEEEDDEPAVAPKREPKPKNTQEEFPSIVSLTHAGQDPYQAPPLSLLGRDSGKPNAGDVKANSNIIKRTLSNFGIEVEMDEVSIGPSITRYALKPAEGVKLSRIVGLQNDLSLALAAHPLRVEAPIPGKALVGIEVPNSVKTTIRLGSLLGSNEFKGSEKPLLVALGKGISGSVLFANLAKMPHVLIAGTTGSGKSVTIHNIIASLLYRNGPELLRFIMVDPKRVELTLYNNIPHLLTPVITQPKKAIMALKWAAKEMDRRYDVLEAESVRDISSYHENVLAPALEEYNEALESGEMDGEELDEMKSKLPEPMPYIVVLIDELADIMTAYPRELEAAIVRLAQMSRAVGIHLVLSTQRPSTEVITGLIKANVPARIALQVPSQIDSRTIIDAPGADKLLGAGDMLYLGSEMSKPQRLQSAFVTEGEVKKVVKFIIGHNEETDDAPDLDIPDSAGSEGGGFDGDSDEEEDDLYEDARRIVIEMKKASSSLLQRKLKVGYARAARLIDMLEERGVVGPAEGSKPREVYDAVASGGNHASDNYADEFDREQESQDDEEEEEPEDEYEDDVEETDDEEEYEDEDDDEGEEEEEEKLV